MKKHIYLLAFSMLSFAPMGEETNFSGTWKLNNEKSTLNVGDLPARQTINWPDALGAENELKYRIA